MLSSFQKPSPVYQLKISPTTFYGKVIDGFIAANDINHIGRRINSRRDKASRQPLKDIYDYDPSVPKPTIFPYSSFITNKFQSPKYNTDDDFSFKVNDQADREQQKASQAYDQRKKTYEEDTQLRVLLKERTVQALDAEAHSKLKEVLGLPEYTRIVELTNDNPEELWDPIWDHMAPGKSHQLGANTTRWNNLSLRNDLTTWPLLKELFAIAFGVLLPVSQPWKPTNTHLPKLKKRFVRNFPVSTQIPLPILY